MEADEVGEAVLDCGRLEWPNEEEVVGKERFLHEAYSGS